MTPEERKKVFSGLRVFRAEFGYAWELHEGWHYDGFGPIIVAENSYFRSRRDALADFEKFLAQVGEPEDPAWDIEKE